MEPVPRLTAVECQKISTKEVRPTLVDTLTSFLEAPAPVEAEERLTREAFVSQIETRVS